MCVLDLWDADYTVHIFGEILQHLWLTINEAVQAKGNVVDGNVSLGIPAPGCQEFQLKPLQEDISFREDQKKTKKREKQNKTKTQHP